MPYLRKTRDVFVIQGNYGHGWEDENEEDNRKDGKRSLREYRENGPGSYRMVHRLERIQPSMPVHMF
jgi:hypothetical protein